VPTQIDGTKRVLNMIEPISAKANLTQVGRMLGADIDLTEMQNDEVDFDNPAADGQDDEDDDD
jgi:hypothetical protein